MIEKIIPMSATATLGKKVERYKKLKDEIDSTGDLALQELAKKKTSLEIQISTIRSEMSRISALLSEL